MLPIGGLGAASHRPHKHPNVGPFEASSVLNRMVDINEIYIYIWM